MNLAELESAFDARADTNAPGDRRRALDALLESGLPTRRSERWKYTRIEPLAEFALAALSRPSTSPSPDADVDLDALARFDPAGALVFVDGIYDASRSRLPDGVSLSEEPPAAGALQGPASSDEALVYLNAALPTASLVLRLADGLRIDGAIHIVYAAGHRDAFGQVQLGLSLAPGSELALVEHFSGRDDDASMHNTVIRAEIGEDATLRLRRLQALGRETLQATRIEADVAAGGRLETMTLDVGGKLVRNEVNVRLNGVGARVDLQGIYLGDGRQHIDNHTRVDHIARDTVSREDYRGILRERCRCVFNGKVFVHEGADGTDAAQSNPNLLLSDHAEIDTKPELEIYADDVKCAHGATVGQLDATSLFYLRSRGIDEATAEQLLTYAFCREALNGIRQTALRARMERLIAEQIPHFSALDLIE